MKPNKIFMLSIFLLIVFVISSCTRDTINNVTNLNNQNPIKSLINNTIPSNKQNNEDIQNKSLNITNNSKLCQKVVTKNITKVIQKKMVVPICNASYYNFTVFKKYGSWKKQYHPETDSYTIYYEREIDVKNPYDKIMVVDLCLEFYKHIWLNYSKKIEKDVCFTRVLYPKQTIAVSYKWFTDESDSKYYTLRVNRVYNITESLNYLTKVKQENNKDIPLELGEQYINKIGGCLVKKTIMKNETIVKQVNQTINVTC